jgi:hypothetical protein
MGLGSGSAVTLAEARATAAEQRKLVAAGVNPIEAKCKATAFDGGKPTFGQVADAVIASKSAEWRNPKHRAQWVMTLETYAAPLRSRPVDQIDTEAVLGVLRPIWQEKPETASRLRGRIEAVRWRQAGKVAAGPNQRLWGRRGAFGRRLYFKRCSASRSAQKAKLMYSAGATTCCGVMPSLTM